MPYGFSGSPPALPALPGFAGGTPLFTPPTATGGTFNGSVGGGAWTPLLGTGSGSSGGYGGIGLQQGGPGNPYPGVAGGYQNPVAGQTPAGAQATSTNNSILSSDPCSGVSTCTYKDIPSCLQLLDCKVAAGAKELGVYLAVAAVVVVGAYLLIREEKSS